MYVPSQTALEKLIGETGIDEDSHVVIVPAGVSAATDFGRGRAHLPDAEGRGPSGAVDPRAAVSLGRQVPRRRPGSRSGKNIPSPKIFSGKFNEALLAELEEVERNPNATLGRRAGPRPSSPAKEKAGLGRRPMATSRARSTSTARASV